MSRKKDRAPWIKLWGSYAESSTLAGMDPAHRWVGVCLMLLVRTACDTLEEQQTWAVHPNGEPFTVKDIAAYAHVAPRVAREAIADFTRRNFIAIREDGAFGLPKFWKYQETPDAKRKRDGKSGGNSGGDSVQEDRGQRELLRNSPPTPSKKTPPAEPEPTPSGASVATGEPDASAEPESPNRAVAKRVLAALSSARLELVPGSRALRATDTNLATILARLNEGEPESDLLLVVEHEAAKVRQGGDSQWLNPQTPFRPGNWPRRLADAQAARAPRRLGAGANGRQYDATPDEVRARLEAEDALPPWAEPGGSP